MKKEDWYAKTQDSEQLKNNPFLKIEKERMKIEKLKTYMITAAVILGYLLLLFAFYVFIRLDAINFASKFIGA